MEQRRSSPRVASVVVGARLAESDALPCLTALAAQRRADVEVVLAADTQPPENVAGLVDVVVVQPDALVPQLWTAGIEASSGRRVGLLSTQVVPSSEWVRSLVTLAEDAKPAARGGAVEPPPGRSSLAQWVALFCRYSRYLLPIPVPGPDVAADNASYDRDALDAVSDSWRDGFWEPFVHRELRARGYDVVTEQEPVVTVAPGQSLRRLARQRFEHGRNHARLEATTGSRAIDVARIIGAPLVPLVLLGRSGREVWARRRLRARLVLCAPVLLWVHAWWAFGEALGYLDHARGRL